MSKEAMLTTIDNPFDPFTQFDEWNAYDQELGYYTCSYLARFVYSSSELSDLDNELAIDYAMDEIIKHNPLGIYKKVFKDSKVGENS